MIPKHSYRYFVYYMFEKDGNQGYGNSRIIRNCRILTMADIRDVEHFIRYNNKMGLVTISNYILLK